MKSHDPPAALGQLDEDAALRMIVEGTAKQTGEDFFAALVENLQKALGTLGAWVAVFDEACGTLRALAMRMHDKELDGFVYELEGTPCQTAITERRLVHIPERIIELYQGDNMLSHYGAVSYMGVPLYDAEGRVIGQLAVLHDQPLPTEPRGAAIFDIFASRAAAELRRLQAERATREREAQLSRVLDSAMDAIINLDDEYHVVLMNPGARRAFDCRGTPTGDLEFRTMLTEESFNRLRDYAKLLAQRDAKQTSLWIAEGLSAVTSAGKQFQAEATLSHYEMDGRPWFTLILRDVEDRIEAEQKIQTLMGQTQYLREELRELQPFDQITGQSKVLLHALHEVEQVASADTTVLLLGETGTGKELFARALHAASRRATLPLVKINCGAIPTHLIESELFGHEKGAFTGATGKRQGRFALADASTLFLDEIGELPLELQPKLLRVLQEGEFEPVGSSRTVKVDVRVVAATNRDLAKAVEEGTFREDLYYRVNVFPIRIPPLRERGDDVEQLARVFADRYCRQVGRRLAPLSAGVLQRLRDYTWPGNVRELQNVIERGVILSQHGEFDVDRVLPDTAREVPREPPTSMEPTTVHTALELQEMERANIVRALEATGWKVSGEAGAARMLEMNPSTLNSRMRALGIRRPH